MANFENNTGTTTEFFQIGRLGLRFFHSTSAPGGYSFPVSPRTGDLYMEKTSSPKLHAYNGTTWTQLGPSAGGGGGGSMTGSEILAALAPVDGTGSGLDSDLLHGVTPSAFILALLDDPDSATARTTLGALDASVYTAADILTKLKTVDGVSSGLDADVLQGTTPSAFGLSLLSSANAGAARTTLGALASTAYTAADVLSKMLTVDGSGSGLDADVVRGTTPGATGLSVLAGASAGAILSTLGAYAASGGTISGNVTISAAGAPITLNSTNSTSTKITFQDNGSTRGGIQSNSTNPFISHNSAGSTMFYTDTSGNFAAAGNVSAFSDIRLKTDIQPITGALELVRKMNGVRYRRIDTDLPGVGVIAQEMEQVLPEVIGHTPDGMLTVSYPHLVGVLIEAIKDLSAKVNTLTGRLDRLERE